MSPLGTKVRDYAINAVITTIAVGALTLGTGAWARKEDAGDHQKDVQAVSAKVETNAAALNAKLDRILDVICDQAQRQPRTCTAAGPWVP